MSPLLYLCEHRMNRVARLGRLIQGPRQKGLKKEEKEDEQEEAGMG